MLPTLSSLLRPPPVSHPTLCALSHLGCGLGFGHSQASPGGLSGGTTALVDTELGSKALGLPFCFSLEGWLILGPSGTCLSVPETSGYTCLGHRRSLWSPFS